MQQGPEVVIRAQDGSEHVFPPGFDPKKAAEIVRTKSAPAPAAPPTSGFIAPAGDNSFEWGRINPGAAKEYAGNVLDAGIGAAKGVANTVIGLGEAFYNYVPGVKQLSDAVNGQPAVEDPSLSNVVTGQAPRNAFEGARRAVAPTNTAQRIGQGAEQIAEFFIPAGAAEKTAATIATKAAPLFRNAPRLVQAASRTVPRMVTEAAAAGAVTGAQGGDATTGAVMGAAGPIINAGVTAAAGKLKEGAQKLVVQALGPTKERYKAIAERLAPEMLKRGIRGSREGMIEQAAAKLETAGEAVDDALQQFGERHVGTKPLVDALETTKDAFRTTAVSAPKAAADAPAFFVGRAGATEDEVWFKALADAKKNGYKGSVGELRAAFNDRVAQAKALEAEMAQSSAEYGHEAFLSTIRDLGGLRPFSRDIHRNKMRGDYQSIVNAFNNKGLWGQQGGASIFRNKGLAADDMVQQLQNDPRWKHLVSDETDLLGLLDEIGRAGPTKASGKGIEDYLQAAGVRPGAPWWNEAGAAGPKVVEFEPRAIRQIEKLQNVLVDLGEEARVDQLVAIRRAWDHVVKQAGGFDHRAPGGIGIPLKDTTEAWAKREGAGAIRRLLNEEVPELTAINKEFSFWKNLHDVLEQTQKRTQPQGPGLGRQVAEVAGAAAGSGSGVTTAFALGKVARFADSVMRGPRWRMASAQMKDSLADAIMEGNLQKITTTLGRIAAGGASQVTQPAIAR